MYRQSRQGHARHPAGSLGLGSQADIWSYKFQRANGRLYDALGSSLRVDRAVVPALTVKRGVLFEPDWGPRPWGWEPDPA